jgi:hypothetical protein
MEHKFIQDVTTRWNSKYLMIKRFLEQKNCVIDLAPYIHLNAHLSMNLFDEWSILEVLFQELDIFYTVTLKSSKETSKLSKIITVMRYLKINIQKEHILNQS